MSSLPVLVLNSGSSSIKFSGYDAFNGERKKLFEGAVDGIATDNGKFWIKDAADKKISRSDAGYCPIAPWPSSWWLTLSTRQFPAPAAIGHRTVCGGPTIRENQLVTPELINEIDSYARLAPLHTPIAVYIMREALQVVSWNSEFRGSRHLFSSHHSRGVTHMPIPEEYAAMGVRRYGYHGISYESIIYQLQPNVPEKLIVAHLGNGASISAIRNGKCLDTSMGLTPSGGIISGSRTGDIDPGVVFFILQDRRNHAQRRRPPTSWKRWSARSPACWA